MPVFLLICKEIYKQTALTPMKLPSTSDACPFRKFFVPLPTLNYVSSSIHNEYEEINLDLCCGVPPSHRSFLGWHDWCTILNTKYYGKKS